MLKKTGNIKKLIVRGVSKCFLDGCPQNTEDRKLSTVTVLYYFEKNNILKLILVLL